jgi:hypothetical protein
MDTDLRIPVTTEQKGVIDAATADDPGGMAEWARGVLLRAAQKRLTQVGKAKGRKQT